MLSFLYEQYGYYPIDVINNSFEIGEWKFKLEEVTCDENFLVELDGYLEKIRNSFNGSGAFIIKTRFGNSISIYDGKKYVLISVQNKKMSMQDLNKMHAIFVDGSRKVNLNNVLKVWQERMSFVENEAIKLLRTDSVYYKTNVEVAMFCLGLTQNAIQYLSETIADYGDTILPLTLTHKRLKDLNSFDFFNPFNLIVDHPIKDLCELYKSGFISFADFCEVVKYYNMDSMMASVVVARILYPIKVLDDLEDNISKKDVSFNLNYNVEKEYMKIKKIYSYLKAEYNIRPINWLEG